MNQVGILGGGFNPPHKAHLFAVTDALASGQFDEIWIIPCFYHALAKNSELESFEHRLQMCHLAFNQWPNVFVQEYERIYQTTYTIDLIYHLIKDFPNINFTLIIGSDNAAIKNQWKNWEILKTLVSFYTVPRPRTTDSLWVMPDISSTQIRSLTAHKATCIKEVVPKSVYEYIIENKLYR